MTAYRRSLLGIVLSVVLLLSAAYADNTPPAACRGFYAALQSRDFGTAWHLLSNHSQTWYIEQASQVLGTDDAGTRKLFDSNDAQLAPFWNHIREHARPDIFMQLQYKTESINGDRAVVRAIGPKGSMPLQAVREGGTWRFGVAESSGQ